MALTHAVAERYPETPLYGGAFAAIVAHLTVAHVAEATPLNPVDQAMERAFNNRLPISATVTEVVLLDDTIGPWQIRARFSLGND